MVTKQSVHNKLRANQSPGSIDGRETQTSPWSQSSTLFPWGRKVRLRTNFATQILNFSCYKSGDRFQTSHNTALLSARLSCMSSPLKSDRWTDETAQYAYRVSGVFLSLLRTRAFTSCGRNSPSPGSELADVTEENHKLHHPWYHRQHTYGTSVWYWIIPSFVCKWQMPHSRFVSVTGLVRVCNPSVTNVECVA
jgi:hypothetical protein